MRILITTGFRHNQKDYPASKRIVEVSIEVGRFAISQGFAKERVVKK